MKPLANIGLAGLALALAPFAVVADVLTLPGSAYEDRHPFERTRDLIRAAGAAATEAVQGDSQGGEKA